jgi:hypothetical protein
MRVLSTATAPSSCTGTPSGMQKDAAWGVRLNGVQPRACPASATRCGVGVLATPRATLVCRLPVGGFCFVYILTYFLIKIREINRVIFF